MTTAAWPWSALDLEPGADERSVRRAYARILKQQRPDADPDAFQRLRSAYEGALALAQHVTSETVYGADRESLRQGAALTVAISSTAIATATGAELRDVGNSYVAGTTTLTEPEAQAEVPKHDPVQEAVQRWQDFVADPTHDRSHEDISRLFDEVVSFAARDELEWQALLYCARENSSPTLRMHLCDVFEWREDHQHLLRRDAVIINMALARANADEDYETLSSRYPAAIALLEDGEGMRKRMKRIVSHPDLEHEMTALIASLNQRYQNVRRFRIDASLIELWQERQAWRARIIGLVLSLTLQSVWFGFLVASASTMRGKTGSDWHGPWNVLQIALAFVGVLTYLLGACLVARLAPKQRTRIQALREKTWVRYGWIVLWLVTTAAALATGPDGAGATATAAALAACTLWATVAYGLLPAGRLVLTSLTYAVGFGFVGHWAAVDRPLWILAFAHSALIAYFLHFALASLRALVVAQPRLALGLSVAWFAALVIFLMQLQSGESQASQYAWALFSIMVPVASGMVTDGSRSQIGDAIPFPVRNILIVVYWGVVGLVTPNLAAGVALLILSVRVIGEIKRVRNTIKESTD